MDRTARPGSPVIAVSRWEGELHWIATTGVTRGVNFPVVWICSPGEWEASRREHRDPEAVPWPARDVRRPPSTGDATAAEVLAGR